MTPSSLLLFLQFIVSTLWWSQTTCHKGTILVDISSHPKTPDLLGEPKREEGKKKGQPMHHNKR